MTTDDSTLEQDAVKTVEVQAETVVSFADGRMVTSSDSIDSPIVRRIHEIIGQTLSRAPLALIAEIEDCATRGDMESAAQALITAHGRGDSGLVKEPLATASASVRLDGLAPATVLVFARARCEIAQGARLFVIAAGDAQFLLDRGAARDGREKCWLQMVVALGDYEKGERESALLRFRAFADDDTLDAIDRAWAWRNVSFYLPLHDEQCERAARQASDLFLSAGDKREAASCVVRAVRSRLKTNPPTAPALLDEVLSWIGDDHALDRLSQGGMLQNRARANMMVGRARLALPDAVRSVELLRGIIGAERELATSLSLAAAATQELGEDPAPLLAEWSGLMAKVEPDRHAARRAIVSLAEQFDHDEYERVRELAIVRGDASLRAELLMVEAVGRPGLTDAARIAGLEGARATAAESDDEATLVSVLLALADMLLAARQGDRALAVFRDVHECDPTNSEARRGIAKLLHTLGRHRDEARFFEDEMARWGPLPGLRFSLGRALLLTGEADRAANLLSQVARDTTVPEGLQKLSAEWRDKALDAGGKLTTMVPRSTVTSRSEVESAIFEFADYVKRAKRMEFWRREPGTSRTHAWLSHPEQFARNLLHTFLEARFGEQVEAFEEVGSGAGRIDLYLRFDGGLVVIIELKMLGGSYSSSYAWEGRSQLAHYMDNRRSALGYLVVFDGRKRDWGEPPEVQPPASDPLRTITIVWVDVRPTMPESLA